MNNELQSSEKEGNPNTLALAKLAYKDALDATQTMPKLFGISFAFLAIIYFLTAFPAPEFIKPTPTPQNLGNVVVCVLQGFLITPIQIAIYQKYLRNELTESYKFAGTDGRSAQFFLVSQLINIPIFLSLINFTLLISAIFYIAGLYISIKTVMIYPAIAINETTLSVAKAWAQTKGRFWRTIWIPLIAIYPWLILTAIIAVAETLLENSDFKAVATSLFAITDIMISATISAAIARIYQEIQSSQRFNTPQPPAQLAISANA